MQTKKAMLGHQGIHEYYTTTCKWGELAQLAVFPDELSSLDEDQQMQRGLAKTRLGKLTEYLTEERDHFFSALTLVVLPRNLDEPARPWTENSEDWDYHFERAPNGGPGSNVVGDLKLSWNVRLFPADGQHRLRAGIDALKRAPDLAKEEVPVVLIPYRNPDQVRQLFSDLNLNVKPVSKTIGYSFDTRGIIVLTAKYVARSLDLFEGRVNRVSNSLSRTSTNVITMNTLVEGTRQLMSGLAMAAEFNSVEEYIEAIGENDAGRQAAGAWEVLINAFQDLWEPVLRDIPNSAGELREAYVFPHGLGWQALATAGGALIGEFGDDWAELFDRAVAAFDWRRQVENGAGVLVQNPVWQGVAMIGDRVNNTGPGIKATADLIVNKARAIAGVANAA